MTKKCEPPRRGSPAPVSVRLTFEERAALDQAAGKEPISQYIRTRLFSEQAIHPQGEVPEMRFSPKERQKLLAKILGLLGRSEAAASLADLVAAAKMGLLPLSPDVLSQLRRACADVAEIRVMLMRALGLRLNAGDHDHEG